MAGKWAGGELWGRSQPPGLDPRDLSPNTCAPRINHASALQFSHLHNGTTRSSLSFLSPTPELQHGPGGQRTQQLCRRLPSSPPWSAPREVSRAR